jgi:hypothetical protein
MVNKRQRTGAGTYKLYRRSGKGFCSIGLISWKSAGCSGRMEYENKSSQDKKKVAIIKQFPSNFHT